MVSMTFQSNYKLVVHCLFHFECYFEAATPVLSFVLGFRYVKSEPNNLMVHAEDLDYSLGDADLFPTSLLCSFACLSTFFFFFTRPPFECDFTVL